jgi:hypothetical protein
LPQFPCTTNKRDFQVVLKKAYVKKNEENYRFATKKNEGWSVWASKLKNKVYSQKKQQTQLRYILLICWKKKLKKHKVLLSKLN